MLVTGERTRKMTMAAQPTGYLSYLLRLWREGETGRSCWRASLESPVTGERVSFSDVAGLFAFLSTKIGLESGEATVGETLQRADNRIDMDV